jgi:glycosyltransferase involved in cell wall biosynthesis
MNEFSLDQPPRITVVTPSFNQGIYLEETILSVIGQGYPNLEYIVIDGGSTDGSVQIIKKYEKQLAYWISEKDNGQAEAINKGFAKSTGEILCWLNSDDFMLPGCLQFISRELPINEPSLLFGNCFHFSEGEAFAYGSDVVRKSCDHKLRFHDYIIQPSAFWNRKAWELTGSLAKNYHFVFDWDWFIRAQIAGVRYKPVQKYLSVYRIHAAHKTGVGGSKRKNEIAEIYRTYEGEDFANYSLKVLHGRDKIQYWRNWINRFHLKRWEHGIFKILMPEIYSNYSLSFVESVIHMYGK